MDVYVDKKSRVWLIDFGEFGGVTDPLLFTWAELAGVPAPPPPLSTTLTPAVDTVAPSVAASSAGDDDDDVAAVDSGVRSVEVLTRCCGAVTARLTAARGVRPRQHAHHMLPDDMFSPEFAASLQQVQRSKAQDGGVREGEGKSLEELLALMQAAGCE